MADYLTFDDIKARVARAIKDPQERHETIIGEMVNMVYLTEVLQADELKPLHWLHHMVRRKFHARMSVTNITGADPGVVTVDAAHGFQGGEIISFFSISGMTELNWDYMTDDVDMHGFGLYMVGTTIPSDTTFQIYDLLGNSFDTSGLTAYASGGYVHHHGWDGNQVQGVTSVGVWDGTPLSPISWEEIMRDPEHYIDSSTSTPERYLFYKLFYNTGEYSHLLTFPAAQENDIALIMCDTRVDPLSADTDVPLLPYQFHPMLVAGTITRMAETGIQVETPQLWPVLYAQQTQALVNRNQRWWRQHEAQEDVKPYGLI